MRKHDGSLDHKSTQGPSNISRVKAYLELACGHWDVSKWEAWGFHSLRINHQVFCGSRHQLRISWVIVCLVGPNIIFEEVWVYLIHLGQRDPVPRAKFEPQRYYIYVIFLVESIESDCKTQFLSVIVSWLHICFHLLYTLKHLCLQLTAAALIGLALVVVVKLCEDTHHRFV